MTPLLQVESLRTWFDSDRGPIRAVDGVDFKIETGRTLGVVGESGSGQSVRALLAARPRGDARARRHDPGADPGPDVRPARAARYVDPPDHARPGRRRGDLRRRRRHVCGTRRRARPGGGRLHIAAAPVYGGAAAVDPDARG